MTLLYTFDESLSLECQLYCIEKLSFQRRTALVYGFFVVVVPQKAEIFR
jgi:hypothetical protein